MYNCQKDEYGTLPTEEECKEYKILLEERSRKCSEAKQMTLIKLENLSEIMRIYGKVEWNRAKEGK